MHPPARKLSKSQSKASAPGDPVEFVYLSLQRTQSALVGMLLVCAVLGMTAFRVPPGSLGARGYLPVILSTTLVTFAYTIRNAMVLPALQRLRRNRRDAEALRSWRKYTLVVLSLCAAVGLTGFASQLMGAVMVISLTMYAIAIAYLFLLRPVRP